jgi:hypothetical protein
MKDNEKIIYNFEDIGFSVIAEPDSHKVDYKVYQISGKNNEDQLIWCKDNDHGCSGFCENLDEADLFLHGYVKWDGCSNWHFDEQDDVMIHFCERDQMENIGKILTKCYDLTKNLIGSWDGD